MDLVPILKKRGSKDSQKSSQSKCSFVLPPDLLDDSESGFRIKLESDPIVVKEHNVSKFSLPAEALTYEPPPDQIFSHFKNGDKERKIHCNTELEPEELRKLCQLQQEAFEQGAVFFPSVASMATRFLSRSRGDYRKALKLMQVTQEWREKYFKAGPLTYEDVREDLGHGIVYFCGRDRCLRPTVVVRGNRIPQQWYKEKRVDKLIRVLVFCTEYFIRYMVVPGKVENLNVIFDLKGLGISQVPVHALSEVYGIMSNHYIGRVFRFYVANVPFSLRALSSVAMAMMTDRQKQKLTFLDNFSKLKQEFAPHQLERDFGGALSPFTEFYPFPLEAGPFGPDATGPDSTAVPYMHKVMTAAGARGALWDPRRSAEENTALRYAADAADLLRQCGLDAQVESLQEGGSDESVTSPPARVTSASKIASRDVTPVARRGADVDNEDLLSPQVKKPDSDLSQASTEACDSDISLNNEAAPPSPSPAQLRARAARLLRGAQRSGSLRAAVREAKAGARVTEEAPASSQMCQASGIFGLPTCWLQPASGR
jgi:hypothetical protein